MQIITLNPSDYVLSGKVREGETDVRVICDTETAGFTITLPDLLMAINKQFTFYNVPESGAGDVVTVQCVTGQIINDNQTSFTVHPFEVSEIVSDKRKRWVTAGGVIVETGRVTDTPYNVGAFDSDIFCDTDGNAILVNLPVGTNGRKLRIINCGTSDNDVTVAPNGSELLTGVNESSPLGDKSVIILTYEPTEGWW